MFFCLFVFLSVPPPPLFFTWSGDFGGHLLWDSGEWNTIFPWIAFLSCYYLGLISPEGSKGWPFMFPIGQGAACNSREVVARVTDVSDAERGDERWKRLWETRDGNGCDLKINLQACWKFGRKISGPLPAVRWFRYKRIHQAFGWVRKCCYLEKILRCNGATRLSTLGKGAGTLLRVPDVHRDAWTHPPCGCCRGGTAAAESQRCAGPCPMDTVTCVCFLSVIFRGKCGVPMGSGWKWTG